MSLTISSCPEVGHSSPPSLTTTVGTETVQPSAVELPVAAANTKRADAASTAANIPCSITWIASFQVIVILTEWYCGADRLLALNTFSLRRAWASPNESVFTCRGEFSVNYRVTRRLTRAKGQILTRQLLQIREKMLKLSDKRLDCCFGHQRTSQVDVGMFLCRFSVVQKKTPRFASKMNPTTAVVEAVQFAVYTIPGSV